MSDRPKAAYPTAPIAWMSEAYETKSPKTNEQNRTRSPATSTVNTVTSLER